MNINKPPNWIRNLYHSFNWKVEDSPKDIFLTFDDGPTPEITSWVVNQLEIYNAKATFFCIGRNVERHPEIYDQLIDKGHAVGNHTYSHLKGWKTEIKEYISDINLASYFIKSKLFRPPYGKIRPQQIRQAKKAGYKLFMWDVLSEDYNKGITKEQCLQNVISNATCGSIIVFHDSEKAKENLYYALPKVLEHLKEQGYNFRILK